MNPNANVYIPDKFPCSPAERERNHLSFAEEMARRGLTECDFEIIASDMTRWTKQASTLPIFHHNHIYRFVEPRWRKFRDLGEFFGHGADTWWLRYVRVKHGTSLHRITGVDVERDEIRIGGTTMLSLRDFFDKYERAQYLDGQWVFTPAGVEGE